MENPEPNLSTEQQVLNAIHYLVNNGGLPTGLPDDVKSNPTLVELSGIIESLQTFTLAMANGDLETEVKVKGKLSGSLKSLQASLRHLTWQAQRIAAGDLTQRVRFMGDFSNAFNTMVESLDQSRKLLVGRARDLLEERQAAVILMQEAQAARKEVEASYLTLQEHMDEIKALQIELQEQAIHDSLTGCFNRRYLNEMLDREFARAKREGYPVSLIMIDIDNFKLTNDTYGHPAGDEVLHALGHLLLNNTRAGDIVCRYGGEEFLLVLCNIRLENAIHRAEACRLDIHELKVPYLNHELSVTVSLGVAVFPHHGLTNESMIQAADTALYLAKEKGRNRTCIPEQDSL